MKFIDKRFFINTNSSIRMIYQVNITPHLQHNTEKVFYVHSFCRCDVNGFQEQPKC